MPVGATVIAVPYTYSMVVPYYQVDQQGVAFNMWYLGWLDEAMSGFLASVGRPYDGLIRDGLDVQLVHTELDWRGSARWADQVLVAVTADAIGTTSFTLGFQVAVGPDVVATAKTVYVMIGTDGSGKRELPASLRSALESGRAQ